MKSNRSLRLAAIGLGALLAVYLLLVIFGRAASWYPTTSDSFVLLFNTLASVTLIYVASTYRGKSRRFFHAWMLMGCAQGLYLLGDFSLIMIQKIQGVTPLVSFADVFYLAYYPLFIVGLLLLPGDPLTRDERQKVVIDTAIIMLAAGLLVWNFIIAPATVDATPAEIFFSGVYPVFDLILLFVLVLMLFRGSQHNAPVLLLQAAVLTLIASDTGYILESLAGTYAAGHPIDWLYALGYSFVALAGIAQYELGPILPAPTRPTHSLMISQGRLRWTVYMPYAWGGAAFLVLAFHERVSNVPLGVSAFVVGMIFILVTLRQFLSYSENMRLYLNEVRRRLLSESLAHAAREMVTSLDLQALPLMIMEQLAYVVPYERCSIMLERNKHLYIAAQRGFPEGGERTSEVNIPIREDDVYLTLAQTYEPVIIKDVTLVPNWTILPWLPLNKSWIGVPLIVRGRVIGMFSLTRKEANAFTEEETILAKAFAGQAAVALDNARLYGDLNQAYQTLEILDRTKSSFIEVVAHELRTPLTVIKGYTQTLGAQPVVKGDEQNRALMEGITRGVDRMQGVVNNMLDVIKIENEVLQIHKVPVSLNELFGRIASHYEKVLEERSLRLYVDGMPALPVIQADPELLNKVFMQLVMNAIKYTPDGGEIRICGRYDHATRLVEIEVADTGIGIDAAQIEVIFEKFYQTGQVGLHSSGQTKFKGGGPGLGLPIARGIVAAHGGKIWVESPGHDETTLAGSTFFVRLPTG